MLPKRYDFHKSEKRWQRFWERERIFKFNPKSKKPVYSIDTPPPYASAGHLHIGHALHYTQFEIIARFRRMFGFNVYFPPCFDNNGLPTEKYVEEKFGIDKSTTTKHAFRKLCLKESKKIERAYANRVFRGLGHSYDWKLLYTTIDPEAQKVSQMSFLDLWKKNLAYRSEEPTLWCTKHETALAQAEIEDLKRNTVLNYILFDVGGGERIEIATTRPEFLPACVAVFVHPDDKRYKKLIGKKARVPLFGNEVEIMGGKEVDMEFGTGIMMVCTFGDTADIEKWKVYKLPLKICITRDGKLNKLGVKYEGMELDHARKEIVKDLEKEERITRKENIEQTVGTCWRCQTPIEFLPTKQWFIKTLKFKKELIAQGRKINWFPGFYQKRFEDWTRNLAWDWCISRQRFYGVPIPVWYCKKCGKPKVPEEKDLPVDPEVDKPKGRCECGSRSFLPEEDVFDTWMTSSMSPEIAIRWLERPKDFERMFPVSMRPQSHDIIRTWAFYTILKAYLHFKKIPWKDIAIGTYVLDSKGRGMHKSKGNVIWTEDLIKKYPVDVVRYWVGTATFGEDLPFQEKDFITGKKFLTKLWNASRFVLLNLKSYRPKRPKRFNGMDRWVLSKLSDLIRKTTKDFENYRTGSAKRRVEQFFWHTFCDYYLEIVKDRLYNQGSYERYEIDSAKYTLYHVLFSILKLISPVMPYITEEIYQSYFRKHERSKSVHISDWPKFDSSLVDRKAEKTGDLAIDIITSIRRFKSENSISLAEPLKSVTIDSSQVKPVLKDIEKTMRIGNVKIGKARGLESEIFRVKLEIVK
ncbi:MAG: valine--tRNA ligase [Candidatus Aenigmarchaeota archaeon]|nr:valine--tRNA ligase [Candidatus Aenigmarchaeota archaeon]